MSVSNWSDVSSPLVLHVPPPPSPLATPLPLRKEGPSPSHWAVKKAQFSYYSSIDMAEDFGERLNQLLSKAGLYLLQDEQNKIVNCFIGVLIRWNARTNLTAVRDPDVILERHCLES